MSIEILFNVTLKPISGITNAHNIHQMGCWKPCNELIMSESFCYNYKECHLLTKSKKKKVIKLDSRGGEKKNNTKT
jgi:hypothetical protein